MKKEENENLHIGHRQKLKTRFLEEGLDKFEPHQVLELLLFYAIPQKDTNPLAHDLINKFGTFSKVFEADIKDLRAINGLGENSILLIKMIPDLLRAYMKDRWGERPVLDSSKKAGEYITSLFAGRHYESFFVVSIDAQNRVGYADQVHEGTINEAPVYPRLIVESALRHKALSVIIAHNHPGGSLNASASDIEATKRIKIALESVGIKVVDHIIVAGEKYMSFAERGLL